MASSRGLLRSAKALCARAECEDGQRASGAAWQAYFKTRVDSALALTKSLGGLTLYHKAHARLHHAALAHLALCERAHRV